MSRGPTRILLVDDLEDNLSVLATMLNRPGLETMSALSASEALELCLVHDFALALLDVNMPEMDGVQLAKLLRGTGRTKDIPIIFVTAAYDPQTMLLGYSTGAVDFIFKPIDARILIQKVASFVSLYEQRMMLVEQSQRFTAVVASLREPLVELQESLSALESAGSEPRDAVTRAQAASSRVRQIVDQLGEPASDTSKS